MGEQNAEGEEEEPNREQSGTQPPPLHVVELTKTVHCDIALKLASVPGQVDPSRALPSGSGTLVASQPDRDPPARHGFGRRLSQLPIANCCRRFNTCDDRVARPLSGTYPDHPLVSGRHNDLKGPALVAETHHNSASSIDSDPVARRHLLLGTAFLLLAGFLTLVQFIKGVFPAFLDGLGFWTYGRLRPMAAAVTMFGWLTPTLIGAAYYLVPRLGGSPLRYRRLAGLNVWYLAGVVLLGTGAIGLGAGDGFELFEFPQWADFLLLAGLVVPAFVVTATLRSRSRITPPASLLYTAAAIVWLPVIAGVSNLPGLNPVGVSLLSSFTTAAFHYLWIVGAALGIALYLIPKLTEGPLFSEQIARIGFWTLALAGGASGYSRFTHGPAPDWLETSAIVLGLVLVVVAITAFVNATATVRGRWDLVRSSVPLRFVLAATALLPVPIALSALAGFRSVASIVGLTAWWDGTSFFLLFGIGGWIAAAFIYAALPRMLGRDLYDDRLAEWHLRLTMIGVTSTSVFLWLTGLVAGFTWTGATYSGAYVNTGDGFTQTLDAISLLRSLALVGVLITFVGQLVHGYVIYRTITSGTPIAHEVLIPAEAEGE
ncbi:MAG: cbb3-type cytochrome c oxidase subunit I [Acidimicrobiia bacterium]|nr:cbb3-type cytochrome c oxidase subunit I [Acidimicrobiia bacterium]